MTEFYKIISFLLIVELISWNSVKIEPNWLLEYRLSILGRLLKAFHQEEIMFLVNNKSF